MVITSKLTEVHRVQDVVLAQTQAHGFSLEARWGIRLALDEALSNAIRHGNRGNPDKKVTVDFDVTDHQIRITVCDEGSGFDPNHLPDPTLEQNVVYPHGRGVMLMKAYMTEVSFGGCGNVVTLVKRRNCPRPNP